jgi:hypothetical protein
LKREFSQLCLYFNAAEGFEPADRMEDKHREAFYALWATTSSTAAVRQPIVLPTRLRLPGVVTAATLRVP